MRICVLLLLSILASSLGGQEVTTRPKKVLSPEQQAFQAKLPSYYATLDKLRSTAKQALDAELAREKAGDCLNAQSTYEFNVCFGDALAATEKNFKTYEGALRDLAELQFPTMEGDSRNAAGAGGPVEETEQSVASFKHMEDLWQAYLDAAARIAFGNFGGGTGGPSFELQTRIRLIRGHMRELDTLYDMRLHH